MIVKKGLIIMDMKQYLDDLAYLVNIDSGPGCHEGQSKIAAFFKERFT